MKCYTGYIFIIMLFTYLFFSAYLDYKTRKQKIEMNAQIEKLKMEVMEKQTRLLNEINNKLEGIRWNTTF